MKTLVLGFLLFLLTACASPAQVTGTGLLAIQDCSGIAAIMVVDSQGHWQLMAPDGTKVIGNPTLPPDVALKYAQAMAKTVPQNQRHGITIGDCPAL